MDSAALRTNNTELCVCVYVVRYRSTGMNVQGVLFLEVDCCKEHRRRIVGRRSSEFVPILCWFTTYPTVMSL